MWLFVLAVALVMYILGEMKGYRYGYEEGFIDGVKELSGVDE